MNRLIRYRRDIITVCLVLIAFLGMSFYGIFNLPRLKTWDLVLRLKYKIMPKPASISNIVIIAIDDSSYGGRWPWNRNIFSNLVYRLSLYKPAVIGFALGFFEESTDYKSSDSLFAESLKHSGNVILASYLDKNGIYVRPLYAFDQSALGCGFTNMPLDQDNVIRETRTFIRYAFDNKILDYSFPIKVTSIFLKNPLENITSNRRGIACGRLKVPVNDIGTLHINYSAKLNDFKTVSFSEVIEGKIPLDFIKDKIILVGTTDEVFRDASMTPLEKMSSVAIIANTINMFISSDFLLPVPHWINILAIIIFVLLSGILISRKHILKSALLVIMILAVFIGISFILIANNLIWDFFSIPVVIPAVFIVNSIINYTELLLQTIKVKKIAITDPITGLPTRRYFILRLQRQLKSVKALDNISLVLFSIDNLEDIATEADTKKTDSIIKEIASKIEKSSRKTRNVDFISRYGEKEFCVQLDRTTKQGALSYANRIIRIKIDSLPSLTLSAGIVNINDIKYKTAVFFAKCAEAALTRAREEGRGNIAVYDTEKDYVSAEEYKEDKKISEVDLDYVAEEFHEKHKELAILINQLRIARGDLIKSDKISSMGKVAATIHHDLSKPIGNLKSLLKMSKDTLDKLATPELAIVKKLITTSVEEVQRLSILSDELKDLYRPIKKEVLPVSINLILEEMLNLSSVQITRNRIRLIKNLHPQIPQISANPGELKQVFLNLIINAIEAMPKGGELEVATTPPAETNMVEVIVRDTGCGISPENMDKLFRPFFTTKERERGAGLGLYSSMEIVKKYGGKIKVESTVNKGSTFKVYLPIGSISPP